MLNQVVSDTLLWLTQYTQNLGLSIVIFTIVLKLIFIPITQKSVESAQKMKELSPELKKLQAQHKKDPKALQAAQLELYKKHKINPIVGCLPQLIQIILLIVLYQALIYFFSKVATVDSGYNLGFLWMDISKPDRLFILPVMVALAQLGLSWLMSWPDPQKPTSIKKNKPKKIESKSEKPDISDSMAQMQKQMLLIMPVITGLIAISLPSGLVLYWLFSSIFSLGQQAYAMRSRIKTRFKL